LFGPLTLAQTDPRPAAVLVDEFDATGFESARANLGQAHRMRKRVVPEFFHSSNAIAQICKRNHERQRVYRGLIKTKVEVKCLGLFRNSMHQNPADPDDIGCI
jgi:hypothetical protein